MFKSHKIHRRDKDKAESIVSAVIVIPLVIAILFTMIDFGIFLMNRVVIQNSARDAARTVALVGGSGTASIATPIEKAYGNTFSCKAVEDDISKAGPHSWLNKAYNRGTSTPTECTLMHNLEHSALTNVIIKSVKCGPPYTASVGAPVECTINWQFNGLPGSGLALVKLGNEIRTIGTAESEVKFSVSDMVAR